MSESKRQRAIVETLTLAGYLVVRIQCGGVKVRGGWMQLAPTGFPDLLVVGWGYLECKDEGGRLSPEQVEMHARIRRAGEMVRVVRTPAEALAAVRGGKIREGQAE